MAGINNLLQNKAQVVLLVDDDTQFLSLGQELLEYLGFQALTASQGDQALEIFRQCREEIDLVIMDYNLPRIDGCQLLHQLQTITPDVKVIVASGFFGQMEMDNLQQAGVAGMIHKPFRAQQLHEQIIKILGG